MSVLAVLAMSAEGFAAANDRCGNLFGSRHGTTEFRVFGGRVRVHDK